MELFIASWSQDTIFSVDHMNNDTLFLKITEVYIFDTNNKPEC